MAYKERIGVENLSSSYKDGQVLQHTDLNELESVVKTAINANYEDIQKLTDGTTPVSIAETVSGAKLSKSTESELQDTDDTIPTSKQTKDYVDNKVDGIDITGEVTELVKDLVNKQTLIGVNNPSEENPTSLFDLDAGGYLVKKGTYYNFYKNAPINKNDEDFIFLLMEPFVMNAGTDNEEVLMLAHMISAGMDATVTFNKTQLEENPDSYPLSFAYTFRGDGDAASFWEYPGYEGAHADPKYGVTQNFQNINGERKWTTDFNKYAIVTTHAYDDVDLSVQEFNNPDSEFFANKSKSYNDMTDLEKETMKDIANVLNTGKIPVIVSQSVTCPILVPGVPFSLGEQIINFMGNLEYYSSYNNVEQTELPDIGSKYNLRIEFIFDKDDEGNYVPESTNGGMSYNYEPAGTQVLPTDNVVEYTPSSDYNPATKKYVDDAIKEIPGGGGSGDSSAFTITDITEDLSYSTSESTVEETINAFAKAGKDYIKDNKINIIRSNNVFFTPIYYYVPLGTDYYKVVFEKQKNHCNTISEYTPFGSNTYTLVSYEYRTIDLLQSDLSPRDETYTPKKVGYENNKFNINEQVLIKTNTLPFIPTGDYNPATKKYVDDLVNNISSGSDSPYEIIKSSHGWSDISLTQAGQGAYYTMSETITEGITLHEDIVDILNKGKLPIVICERFRPYLLIPTSFQQDVNENNEVTHYHIELSGCVPIKNNYMVSSDVWNCKWTIDYSNLENGKIVKPLTDDNCQISYTNISDVFAAKVLSTTNTETYTPTSDYHPATKKYVDDQIGEINKVLATLTKVGDE